MGGASSRGWRVPVNVAAIAVGLLMLLTGVTLTVRLLGGVAVATGVLALVLTIAAAVSARRDGGA